MYRSEFHLRLLIREQLLFETAQPAVAESLLIDRINEWLNWAEWGLVAVDVVAIAAGGATAVPTGGASLPVAAVILKYTGFISAGISAVQAISYLADPRGPQWEKFSLEVVEIVLGLLTSAGVARAGSAGAKIALELAGPVATLCKKLFNTLTGSPPTPEDEKAIEQAVASAAQKVSSTGKPVKVVDVNEILTEMAITDASTGTISNPASVELEIIQAGGPRDLVRKESDKIYDAYLEIRNGLDTDDDDRGVSPGMSPRRSTNDKPAMAANRKPGDKTGGTRSREVELAAVSEIPARDYEFDPYDGMLQYVDPRGGIRQIGDVTTMTVGQKVAPALTLFRVDYDSQGNVSAVKLKNLKGEILKVKSMYK